MSRGLFREFRAVQTWLFDFDNTIAALEPKVDWAGSRVKLEAFLRREGVAESIFKEIPKGNLPLYDALLGRILRGESVSIGSGLAQTDPMELMQIASTMIESYELIGAVVAEPLPGAPELLQRLVGRGSQVVIVTSNSSRTVRSWIERFELTRCIEGIVGRDSMLPLKPAPDMVRRALTQAMGTAEEVCFVGDSEADALAADRSGLRFLGIAASEAKRKQLEPYHPIALFANPAELQSRLLDDYENMTN